MITLQKTVTSILLADSQFAHFDDTSYCAGEVCTVEKQSPQSTTYEEVNPANSHGSFSVAPSPVKSSDETTALGDTLLAVSGEPL